LSLSKKEAYEIVYKDLVSKDNASLFRGTYDAVHSSEAFMYGISTVMENIAFHVSEETHYEFNTMFTHNMVVSERRAENILYHKSFKYRVRKNFSRVRLCLKFTARKLRKFVGGVSYHESK
jgi:hypothetical protein